MDAYINAALDNLDEVMTALEDARTTGTVDDREAYANLERAQSYLEIAKQMDPETPEEPVNAGMVTTFASLAAALIGLVTAGLGLGGIRKARRVEVRRIFPPPESS